MVSGYPTLNELAKYLTICGANPGDQDNVASALLGMAHEKQWVQHPDRMGAWLQEIALEVARHWNEHEASALEEKPFLGGFVERRRRRFNGTTKRVARTRATDL